MNQVFKTLIISFFVNCLLVVLKFTIGILTNTQVIIANAIQSFSDLITDIIAIFGNSISLKKEDVHHPKGYGKTEYITNLVMGIIIVMLGIVIIKNTMLEANTIIQIKLSIIVLVSIVIKYILYRYILNNSIKYNNNILKASSNESKADVASSICVLLVVIASLLGKYIKILQYIDKIGAFIISLFVLKTGFKMIQENLSLVIGEVEINEEILTQLRNIILENNRWIEIFEIAEILGVNRHKKLVEDESNSTIAHLINRRLKKEGFITKRINYDKGYSIVVAPPGFSTDNIPEEIQVSSYKNRK